LFSAKTFCQQPCLGDFHQHRQLAFKEELIVVVGIIILLENAAEEGNKFLLPFLDPVCLSVFYSLLNLCCFKERRR
jgi:hypothetical protein